MYSPAHGSSSELLAFRGAVSDTVVQNVIPWLLRFIGSMNARIRYKIGDMFGSVEK